MILDHFSNVWWLNCILFSLSYEFVIPPCFVSSENMIGILYISSFDSFMESFNTYGMWDALKWKKMDNEMQTLCDRICQQDIKWESL